MLPSPNEYVEVSLSFSLIHERNYPVECCECVTTLHNAAESAAHEALTGHFDGCYRLGREQAEEADQLMRAVSERKSADCGVRGVHIYDDRSVN